MKRISLNFYKKLESGQQPIQYVLIQTPMGWRGYGEKELKDAFDPDNYVADGTYLANGSIEAGNTLGIIDKSGRLLYVSPIENTLQSRSDNNILSSYNNKQLQHMSVELDNTDRYFAKLLPKEPFIGQSIYQYLGFEDLKFSEHIPIFKGVITKLSVMSKLTIEADER